MQTFSKNTASYTSRNTFIYPPCLVNIELLRTPNNKCRGLCRLKGNASWHMSKCIHPVFFYVSLYTSATVTYGKRPVSQCPEKQQFLTACVVPSVLSDAVGEWHQWDPGWWDGTGKDHPVHRSHRHDDRKESDGPLPGGGPSLHSAQLDQWIQALHTRGRRTCSWDAPRLIGLVCWVKYLTPH